MVAGVADSEGVLVFRVDSGERIGAGHLMRCLALAHAWQETGGRCVFATAGKSSAAESRLEADGYEVVRLQVKPGGIEDSERTAALARNQNSKWIVADGYHFGSDFQKHLKQYGLRLFMIDDNGLADPQ